jgi:hypothetical protein
MMDAIVNENNNNQNEMINYKGYFVENGRDEEKKFFEYGAHFSYKELYVTLMKLKSKNEKSEKSEKVAKIIPKKKFNLERNNQKDNKIEENINNIIKEFKMKTRSRNIAQQGNKVSLNPNYNQLTFVPLNINQNKMNINNINKSINTNQVIANINSKIRNLNNKYNATRNREQKFNFEMPIFFTDNKNIDMPNENNATNNINILVNNKINKNNKINNNLNLYKSYQNQLKKRREIKLNNTNKYTAIKNNILNEKVNIYKKSRLLSSNFDNYLNKLQHGKFKFSPLKKIPINKFQISGENYSPYKFSNIINNSGYNNSNKKYRLKKFINHKHIIIDSINSFSAENKKKHNSNSANMDKITSIKKNISNISGNSQNNSKNITFQNMLYDLNHSKKFKNQNKKINFAKEGALTNYSGSIQKSKIHNLFKLLNKHEKISRNQNSNYFLNNTSYMQKTQQYDKNKNMNNNNVKNIFLNLNNILMKKERNRVKLTNQLLHNSRNITFNTNNKFFNTSYINNTSTQNNHHHDNLLNRIHTAQNNNNNIYNNMNMRKKPKKNNVNINININNNNKIIYNKVYEYKNPLPSINNSNLIKKQNPVKISNHMNNPSNPRVFRNVGSNNFNTNNNKIKFINIQMPKKKLLNKYNKFNNNYGSLFS